MCLSKQATEARAPIQTRPLSLILLQGTALWRQANSPLLMHTLFALKLSQRSLTSLIICRIFADWPAREEYESCIGHFRALPFYARHQWCSREDRRGGARGTCWLIVQPASVPHLYARHYTPNMLMLPGAQTAALQRSPGLVVQADGMLQGTL